MTYCDMSANMTMFYNYLRFFVNNVEMCKYIFGDTLFFRHHNFYFLEYVEFISISDHKMLNKLVNIAKIKYVIL